MTDLLIDLAAMIGLVVVALAAVIPFMIVLALSRYLIARADRRVRERRADAAAAWLRDKGNDVDY